MQKDTWIRYHRDLALNEPVAVVGSPGLRSIGSLVVDSLVEELNAELVAELYSTHFPLIYQTKPSYASHPGLPGIAGIRVDQRNIDFPKVEFFYHPSPPLIITRGYHANFHGQYEVAEKVLDFYDEIRVRRLIAVAGYGLQGEQICSAATSRSIIEEIREEHGIEAGYEGPFYGFSGLVFGLAKRRGIEALCLFSKTEPRPEEPELPDEEASRMLLKKLAQILKLDTKNRSNP
jgi:proteasome assembly chaperone (PAC2) family protein